MEKLAFQTNKRGPPTHEDEAPSLSVEDVLGSLRQNKMRFKTSAALYPPPHRVPQSEARMNVCPRLQK